MNRLEISDRFAKMWKKSREDSGKSQEYVAKALGVSKKTVQNWEAGISSPSQQKGFEWFQVLDLQPLPYYLEILFPFEFEGISSDDSDQEITDALVKFIQASPPAFNRKLMYILYGDHGSSPQSIVEMITAHLHTPLQARLNVAHDILTNYEIAEATEKIVQPDHVMPNIETLKASYALAVDAVKHNKKSYTMAKEDQSGEK